MKMIYSSKQQPRSHSVRCFFLNTESFEIEGQTLINESSDNFVDLDHVRVFKFLCLIFNIKSNYNIVVTFSDLSEKQKHESYTIYPKNNTFG